VRWATGYFSAASLRFVCVVWLALLLLSSFGGGGCGAGLPYFCLVGLKRFELCLVNDGQCVPDRFAFSMV
jgi:hypothetical protein